MSLYSDGHVWLPPGRAPLPRSLDHTPTFRVGVSVSHVPTTQAKQRKRVETSEICGKDILAVSSWNWSLNTRKPGTVIATFWPRKESLSEDKANTQRTAEPSKKLAMPDLNVVLLICITVPEVNSSHSFQVNEPTRSNLSKYMFCWISCQFQPEESQLIPWTIATLREMSGGEDSKDNLSQGLAWAYVVYSGADSWKQKWGSEVGETGRVNPTGDSWGIVWNNSKLSHQETVVGVVWAIEILVPVLSYLAMWLFLHLSNASPGWRAPEQ